MPASEQHLFEQALQTLADRCGWDDDYAQALYAALCNTEWRQREGDGRYACSWRYAGGLVDDLARYGEPRDGRGYLELYCSGIGAGATPEGQVREDIAADLAALGWHPAAR